MRSARRQLPVFSPVPPAALLRAAASVPLPSADDRPRLLRELLARSGASAGVLCGSGTQALQLAISLARSRAGEAAPVAVPAFTCFDVASAAVGAEAPVAPYDLDPATLAPDLASLERVLAAGARVVVAAWAYGHPPPWDAVLALAERHGAMVVEDAAQGHGGTWRGRPAGSFGELSVLSFGRGKGWTGGRGGALLSHDPDLPLAALPSTGFRAEAANLAATAAQWALGRPALYAVPAAMPGLGLGETIYRDPRPPRAMLRSAAALLVRGRAEAEREAEARRRTARALLDAVADVPGIAPIIPVHDAGPGWLRLPLLASGGSAGLGGDARRMGIAPAYPSTLPALAAVRARLAGPERRFPGADELVRSLVTLPTHSRVTVADVRGILRLLGGGEAPAGAGASRGAPPSAALPIG